MTTMTTVHADTASEGQLNWAVAKTLGMALREPVSAKDEDFADMAVPFKLYDVFNSGSDEIPYYEIRVVTVIQKAKPSGWSSSSTSTLSLFNSDAPTFGPRQISLNARPTMLSMR